MTDGAARVSGGDGHLRASPQAWAAIAGAVDCHVHVQPDLATRRTDDVDLAGDFAACGLSGFVLKSHYGSTAERAAVVRRAVPGATALGAVTLNHGVGGLNPVAVDIAGRGGARYVWLPTVDAANEVAELRPDMPHPPVWAGIRDEMAAHGWLPDPIEVVDADGRITGALADCLDAARAHDMVVATGHLSGAEIAAVVEAAVQRGVRVVVTHPEFPSQALSGKQQVALADAGAIIEHCFTTPYTGKCSWDEIVANIKLVGPERTLISTDLGQRQNPPVAEGLAAFAQLLLDAGLTPADITRMTVSNPAELLGMPAER